MVLSACLNMRYTSNLLPCWTKLWQISGLGDAKNSQQSHTLYDRHDRVVVRWSMEANHGKSWLPYRDEPGYVFWIILDISPHWLIQQIR